MATGFFAAAFLAAGRGALRAVFAAALLTPTVRMTTRLAGVVREGVARLSFDSIATGLTVTFSAGLSSCDDEAPMQACIERADQAMYKAKVTGRNRSVLA